MCALQSRLERLTNALSLGLKLELGFRRGLGHLEIQFTCSQKANSDTSMFEVLVSRLFPGFFLDQKSHCSLLSTLEGIASFQARL